MATLPELETKYFVSGVGVPHSGDTEVIPHLDGLSYFGAIAKAIDTTSNSDDVIYITSWFFDQITPMDSLDESRSIGRLLHDKAAQGVDVRVIVWTGRFFIGAEHVDTDTWWDSAARLAGGIETFTGYTRNVQNNIDQVRDLRILDPNNSGIPPLRGSLMMDHGGGKFGSRHQKCVTTYHKAGNDLRAFVAGLDLHPSRQARPGHPPQLGWHDIGVEFRGGAASSIWTDFRTRWEEARTLPSRIFRLAGEVENYNNPATLNRPPVPPAPQIPKSSNSSVRILRSYAPYKESPLFGDDMPWTTLPPEGVQEVLPTYVKALNAASEFIYIEDQGANDPEYRVEHDTLFAPLAQAANRGVKVILVVPGSPDPVDSAAEEINRMAAGTLQDALFKQIPENKWSNIVMYRVVRTCVHSKLVIIDDQFIAIGSANFYDRSMEGRDTELQAAIVNPDSMIKDFRVNVWADHLRVDPEKPDVKSQLGNTKKSLGIFRDSWATEGQVTFEHPDSALEKVIGT